MRQRTRSTGKDLLSAPENNTRQFVALALALILAVLLIPVGVQAAQTVSAIITDPGGTNQATVDSNGSLQVGGTVGIDSTTPVATTSTDDPARMVFQRHESFSTNVAGDVAFVDVPADHRLVITYVSGVARVPTGQTVSFILEADSGGHVEHAFVPILTRSDGFGDLFQFAQDTRIFAEGQITLLFGRSPIAGQALGNMDLSGYLVDCSVAPCN